MDIMLVIYLSVFIIGAVLNVLIGGWIGSAKGRAGMGQLLGLLCGPLGWLIVALLPAMQQTPTARASTLHASRGKLCPMCGTLAPQGNTVCATCQSSIYAP